MLNFTSKMDTKGFIIPRLRGYLFFLLLTQTIEFVKGSITKLQSETFRNFEFLILLVCEGERRTKENWIETFS
jgi:hypothetical protein